MMRCAETCGPLFWRAHSDLANSAYRLRVNKGKRRWENEVVLWLCPPSDLQLTHNLIVRQVCLTYNVRNKQAMSQYRKGKFMSKENHPEINKGTYKSKLRQVREAAGMTLVELAAAIGIDHSGLSRVERFEQQSVKSAALIVEFFGRDKITVEDILYPPKEPCAEQEAA